jgi:hypothetical protein
MTEIRTCWAHNIAGERCGKRASHKGNHSLTIEWDDSECYEPKTIPDIPVRREMAPLPEPIAKVLQADPTMCVACSHRHAGGACKCGCYEFVG